MSTGWLIFVLILFIYILILIALKEYKMRLYVKGEDIVKLILASFSRVHEELCWDTVKVRQPGDTKEYPFLQKSHFRFLEERFRLLEAVEKFFETGSEEEEKRGPTRPPVYNMAQRLQKFVEEFPDDFCPEMKIIKVLLMERVERIQPVRRSRSLVDRMLAVLLGSGDEDFIFDADGNLVKQGNILQRYNISLWGPFLMWRTIQGKKIIDKIAQKRRLWQYYGDLSLVIVLFVMFAMTLLLLIEAVIVFNIGKENAPSPSLMIGIPGVNPVIPLWYGIFALAVAMVVHEGAHGILTRVGKLKVKSLGLLVCIVPMGAFVEPDEERIMRTGRRIRSRIFAVGPATNIIVAIFCALLFAWGFMGSIEPEKEGIFVMQLTKDGPADEAGLEPGMLILAVDSNATTSYDQFADSLKGKADTTVNVTTYEDGKEQVFQVSLENKYNHSEDKDDDGTGYIGIFFPLSTTEHRDVLAHPMDEGDTPFEKVGNVFHFISLPFKKLSPFPQAFTQHYDVKGPLGVLPESGFWVLANAVYWIFWLNLMVGLTNALPAVPLDGGYIFNDMLDKIIAKYKPKLGREARQVMVEKVTYVFAYSILFLILWQLVGPYVGSAFS